MIPYIKTTFGNIPTFALFVMLGILSMIFLIFCCLRKNPNHIDEENFILSKIVFSGLAGYFASGIFDACFKINIYGRFKITGITFYGGLIGATLALFVVLKITKGKTQYSVKEWFDLLTIPFITFHIFGRVGCFFGGCCYGKPTESFLGVAFPDNIRQNIFHDGAKCYPTQLFEAVALLMILLILLKNKNKFENYVLLYSIARFIIEFFRGDERGSISNIFSPAQVISVGLFVLVLNYKGFKVIKQLKGSKGYTVKKRQVR